MLKFYSLICLYLPERVAQSAGDTTPRSAWLNITQRTRMVCVGCSCALHAARSTYDVPVVVRMGAEFNVARRTFYAACD